MGLQGRNKTDKNSKSIALQPQALDLDEIVSYQPQLTPQKNTKPLLTPESIRPFLKATPRKKIQCGRKAGKTRILMDTPEKKLQKWKNKNDRKKRENVKTKKEQQQHAKEQKEAV